MNWLDKVIRRGVHHRDVLLKLEVKKVRSADGKDLLGQTGKHVASRKCEGSWEKNARDYVGFANSQFIALCACDPCINPLWAWGDYTRILESATRQV